MSQEHHGKEPHVEHHAEHHSSHKKPSRSLWFIVGAIIVLAVVGGAYHWLTSSPTRAAFLNLEEGAVEVDQGSGWETALDDMSLGLSDKVRTLQGKATILLFESILISLDENTEVSIAALAKDKSSIKQEKGSTWHKFTSLAGVQSYEVVTPTTVATVRGTSFGVDTLEDGDDILVGEGSVGVASEGEQAQLSEFEKIVKKKGSKFDKKAWSLDDKKRLKRQATKHIQHLKNLRKAELKKKHQLMQWAKKKYRLSDADVDKFFDDVDAGKRNDEEVLSKVPIKSESLAKIKRLDDQIKKEQKFLQSLGDV